MGATYVEATVQSPNGQEAHLRFLVDSGATYSLLPNTVWKQLGLEPKRRVTNILRDGTTLDRDVSECCFFTPHGSAHSPVFLGEVGDEAIIGKVTFETLGLVFNPFNQTLTPMRMLLA